MDLTPSCSTVTVRFIDTTTRIITPNDCADCTIKGAQLLNCPLFAFLIERRLLLDLGLRPDYENLPPVRLSVEKGVSQLLAEHGVDPKTIEAIIWSHWHYDHTGDPSTFPSTTLLMVGPVNSTLRIMKMRPGSAEDAIDYFGEKSFYILDAPGHTLGHLCALAPTTNDPDSFILMGADACHRSAEMRPSKWLPLPSEISPHQLQLDATGPGPASDFEHLLRNDVSQLPIYAQKRPGQMLFNPDMAEGTLDKIEEADGTGNIFVVIAHDDHLSGTVDFSPKPANKLLFQGWDVERRWKFLADFRQALLGGHKLSAGAPGSGPCSSIPLTIPLNIPLRTHEIQRLEQ
ncbi:beta-lactamase-like protein [Aspergillus germanicus]